MSTQELGTAFETAQSAYRDKVTAKNTYVKDRVEKERTIAGTAAALIYDDDIKALRATADAAYSAHRAALDADARAGVGAKFPLGTLFVEWERPRERWATKDEPQARYQKTGNRARYIARTTDTIMPAMGRTPSLGEYFFQVVKRDGSAGIAIVKYNDLQGYFPEGIDPNEPGNTAGPDEYSDSRSAYYTPLVKREPIILE